MFCNHRRPKIFSVYYANLYPNSVSYLSFFPKYQQYSGLLEDGQIKRTIL